MSERKVKRSYWWNGLKDERYDSEDTLKEAHGEACDPGKHVWLSTFVFSTYRCRKCRAWHEVESNDKRVLL